MCNYPFVIHQDIQGKIKEQSSAYDLSICVNYSQLSLLADTNWTSSKLIALEMCLPYRESKNRSSSDQLQVSVLERCLSYRGIYCTTFTSSYLAVLPGSSGEGHMYEKCPTPSHLKHPVNNWKKELRKIYSVSELHHHFL